MQMNLKYIHFNDFKHNADTVVIFFTLALVERRNPSNSNNIRDVINFLKKGFRLERDILGKYPDNGGKTEKTEELVKKYPFHQPIRRQHSDIRWN